MDSAAPASPDAAMVRRKTPCSRSTFKFAVCNVKVRAQGGREVGQDVCQRMLPSKGICAYVPSSPFHSTAVSVRFTCAACNLNDARKRTEVHAGIMDLHGTTPLRRNKPRNWLRGQVGCVAGNWLPLRQMGWIAATNSIAASRAICAVPRMERIPPERTGEFIARASWLRSLRSAGPSMCNVSPEDVSVPVNVAELAPPNEAWVAASSQVPVMAFFAGMAPEDLDCRMTWPVRPAVGSRNQQRRKMDRMFDMRQGAASEAWSATHRNKCAMSQNRANHIWRFHSPHPTQSCLRQCLDVRAAEDQEKILRRPVAWSLRGIGRHPKEAAPSSRVHLTWPGSCAARRRLHSQMAATQRCIAFKLLHASIRVHIFAGAMRRQINLRRRNELGAAKLLHLYV